MQNRTLVVVLLTTCLALTACDALMSDIDGVKAGRLDFDNAATIGDTFDSYKLVEQPGKWSETTERGKKYVTWTAKVQAQQPVCVAQYKDERGARGHIVGTPAPCNITGFIAVVFVILPDDTLQVNEGQAQLKAASLSGKTTDQRTYGDAEGVLKAIYRDELPFKFGLYENP